VKEIIPEPVIIEKKEIPQPEVRAEQTLKKLPRARLIYFQVPALLWQINSRMKKIH